MRSLKSICAFLAVLTVGSLAHADTVYTFSNMSLTENKGGNKIYGTVSGDVTIDSLGKVTSADFTATYGATHSSGDNFTNSFTFTNITTATHTTGGSPAYDLTVFEDTTNTIFFDLEYTFVGGVVTLCSEDKNGFSGNGACDQGGTGEQTFLASRTVFNTSDEDLVSGSLVPTPEPSSILLLGTGVVGVLGAARRRLVRR